MKLFELVTSLKESTPERSAEKYAKQLGVGDITWLGSGEWGEAYTTEKDTVIKVTTDNTEFKFATQLVNHNLANVVSVYNVNKINDHTGIIHMEYLNQDGVEDLYAEAESLMNDTIQYTDFLDFDVRDIEQSASKEVLQFIDDIASGVYQLQSAGIQSSDHTSDNIGRKQNGKYAIFDITFYYPG